MRDFVREGIRDSCGADQPAQGHGSGDESDSPSAAEGGDRDEECGHLWGVIQTARIADGSGAQEVEDIDCTGSLMSEDSEEANEFVNARSDEEGDEGTENQGFCKGAPEVRPGDTGGIRGESGTDESADQCVGGGDWKSECGGDSSGDGCADCD